MASPRTQGISDGFALHKKLRVGRPFRSFGGLIEELMHLDASLAENCP